MSVTGKDSLSEASAGVALTAHTPSGAGATGGPWVSGSASYTDPLSLSGGGFAGSTAVGNAYLSGSTSAAPDYVQCQLTWSTTPQYDGVGFFLDALRTGGHGYLFEYYHGSGWNITRDGGAAILASYGVAPTLGHTYTVRLERTVSGGVATLTAYLDGTQVAQATDSTYIAKLYGGVCSTGGTAVYANFETGTIGGGSGALTAGTLSSTADAYNSVSLALSADSGGTAPYSNQLQRSPSGAGTWVNIGSAVTGPTPTFVDSTVAAATAYDYRVVAGDSVAATATSNVLTVTTPPGVPSATFTADNAGFVYYGRWGVEGTQRRTITNGALCEFAVSGVSSVNLAFDGTVAANFPSVAYWVDGVGPTRAAIGSSGLISVAFPAAYNAVAYTTHRVKFCSIINSEYPTSYNDWSSQQDALRFVGIQAAGGTMLALPSNPNTIEFLGDSITAGLRTLYTGTDGVATECPEIGWAFYAADLLGLKPALNGHGGQGITVVATDGTPVAVSAFPYAYSGRNYAPANPPAVVWVYQGTNDSSFTQSQYQALLTAVRSAYPSALIFAVVPVGKSALSATVAAAVTAQADAKIFFLDYSGLSVVTTDGLHPSVGGAVTLGAKVASGIQSRLNTLGIKSQASSTAGGVSRSRNFTGAGMYPIKQSSASQPLVFLMVSSSDHVTGATGLSPAVVLSKNGGAFAAPAGTVSEVGSGWYQVAGNAADSGSLGPLILHASSAGADPADARYEVVAFDPQSSTSLGLSNLDAAVSTRSSYAGGPVAGVTGLVSAVLAPNGLDAIETTAPTARALTFPGMLTQLYRRHFAKADLTATMLRTYADDGVTVLTTQTLIDDGTTQTQGAAS